jgi:hypothetical protein
MLARQAVRSQPSAVKRFAWMFGRSGYPEQASVILKMCPDAQFGNTRYDSSTETYTITGSGVDIWGTMDEFHFAWKKLTGGGSITARIDSIENVHEWTKAGVMIRSALAPDCPNAMMLLTPGGSLCFQYRDMEFATTSALNTLTDDIQLPHWVRLTRTGGHFTAEHSNDGVTWQAIVETSGQPAKIHIPMDETVYIGLAVTSHDTAESAQARISHVTTTGNVSPSGSFIESLDIPVQSPPVYR